MEKAKYVIGLDFGTDSVRALLVDARDGREVKSAVRDYSRWKEGKYCDAAQDRFRQHPLDHLEGMESCIRELLAGEPPELIENIAGISAATTGSTPAAAGPDGTPLALDPRFSEDPDAMFVLWKDHTAQAEANEINSLAHRWETDYTCYSGGIYSAEWFWSKMLHILRSNEAVRRHAGTWIEHCDWIPAALTGAADPAGIKRSRCAAGHKAMWNEKFGGLPSEAFLEALDPLLGGMRSRLYNETYTVDRPAGTLSREWAARLGLPAGVIVGTGALDAHVGAIGAGIEPYTLVKVMGTSTCDMLIAPGDQFSEQAVRGICGQVEGSILPGMTGMEAGQSAFGDLYAWFRRLLLFPLREAAAEGLIPAGVEQSVAERLLPALAEKAAGLPLTERDLIALDWINGRRTPDADFSVTGAITGLRLGTDAPQLFKALVEATAFGSKAIVQRFRQEKVPVNEVIALGGIAKKSPYVMQTLADVLDMPIKVARSAHACALGAAMCAATASGIHPDIRTAQQAMSGGYDAEYLPVRARAAVYEQLYKRYCALGLRQDGV